MESLEEKNNIKRKVKGEHKNFKETDKDGKETWQKMKLIDEQMIRNQRIKESKKETNKSMKKTF